MTFGRCFAVLSVAYYLYMRHKAMIFGLGLIVGTLLTMVLARDQDPVSHLRRAAFNVPADGALNEFPEAHAARVKAVTGYMGPDHQEPSFILEDVAQAVVQVLTESTGGSGVVIDPAGVVLTSAHLVDGNENITVRVRDKEILVGTVSRIDMEMDLALVHLPPGAYHSAELGTQADIWVGAPVYSVGYPLNMGGPPTITRGIVSRYLEEPKSGRRNIQTDAAINLGNSGGPILDSKGRVIGIVTSVLGDYPSAPSMGVSFAVSVHTIRSEFLD